MSSARAAYEAARAGRTSAAQSLAAQRALTQGVSVERHPATPAAFQWPTYAGNIHRTSTYGDHDPVVGVDPGALETLQFVLRQNSPNPFGRESTIRWVVPQDVLLTLRVFDVWCRLVLMFVFVR